MHFSCTGRSCVIHHCVRECMPFNVPGKCTCVGAMTNWLFQSVSPALYVKRHYTFAIGITQVWIFGVESRCHKIVLISLNKFEIQWKSARYIFRCQLLARMCEVCVCMYAYSYVLCYAHSYAHSNAHWYTYMYVYC